MISPLSLMSARFKLRVICRILFLIFTTRLITVPGRMSAVSTLIPARLSFSFHIELVSHARAIFQRSLSHLRFLRFLSFVLLSPQFLNRFQTHFIFSRNRKGTRSFSLLSVITRTTRKHEEKRRDLDEIWKMEEIIVEKEHSTLQIVSREFRIVQCILRNVKQGNFATKTKLLSYPYFSARISLPRIKM